MPEKQPPSLFFELASVVLLAFGFVLGMVGGVARHINDSQEKQEKINWYGVFTNGFMGGFVGGITVLYLGDLGFSHAMILAGSGLAGFAGAAALRFATRKISSVLSAESHRDKGDKNG